MSKLSVLIVLSSSLTVIEVSSFNFKYSNGNVNNNNSPGGYYYWNSGYNRPYLPQASQYSQPAQVQTQTEEPDIKDTEEDPEYMYELLFGHQIRDIDKYRRQQGCLCNNRFRDYHCGSDHKVYDNGCYFECAQKRNPGLKLLNWGKC